MSFKIARRHILVGACSMMVLMAIALALYLHWFSIGKREIGLVEEAVCVDFLHRAQSGQVCLSTDYPESTLYVRVECEPNVLNGAFSLPWQRVSLETISLIQWDTEPLQQTDKCYLRYSKNGSMVNALVRLKEDCAVVFFERSSYTKDFPPEIISFMNRHPTDHWAALMPSQAYTYEIEWP